MKTSLIRNTLLIAVATGALTVSSFAGLAKETKPKIDPKAAVTEPVKEPAPGEAPKNAAAAEAPKDAAKDATKAAPAAEGAAATAPAAADVVGAPSGPKVEASLFDDWRMECYDPAVQGMKCQIIQQLVEKDLQKPILVASFAYRPEIKNTQVQIVLPLGFLLKRGVTVAVGPYNSTIAVDRCTAQGCFVEGVAAKELIDAFGKDDADAKGEYSIVADTGQTIRIPFSLKGFAKAYATMLQNNTAAAPAAPAAEPAKPASGN